MSLLQVRIVDAPREDEKFSTVNQVCRGAVAYLASRFTAMQEPSGRLWAAPLRA